MAIDPTGQPVIGTPQPAAPEAGMQVPLPSTYTYGSPQSVATDIVAILPDVLAAIKDPSGLRKSGLAILTAVVGVLASLGFISNGTDAMIVSTAAIILPGIFMIATAIHGHATAQVQAAAIQAKASQS